MALTIVMIFPDLTPSFLIPSNYPLYHPHIVCLYEIILKSYMCTVTMGSANLFEFPKSFAYSWKRLNLYLLSSAIT